jgi:hypothetical protein
MMAMTGNHTAMGTADTVFIKHKPTANKNSNFNVHITGVNFLNIIDKKYNYTSSLIPEKYN